MATSRLPIFQERFKQLRGDLTQAQFAEKLGISRPTVSLYECGERIPDAEVLQTIASKCDVSSDYLIGLAEHPTVSEDMKTALLVTGLSEKAIENVQQWDTSVAARLMETDGFTELMADITDLFESVHLLDNQYEYVTTGAFPIYFDSEGNAINCETVSGESNCNFSMDDLRNLYNLVRLEKYELRDSFSALLEKMIPTTRILSSVKSLLREYGGLNASSDLQGGNENDRE